MPFLPKDPRRGDPIRAALAAEQDAEIVRLGRVKAGPGMVCRTGPSGSSFALDLPERIYIRLTSSADGTGAYAWVQVYHAHALSWTVSADRTGGRADDPAFERGGSTTLAGGDPVYEARRCLTSGEWIFDT